MYGHHITEGDATMTTLEFFARTANRLNGSAIQQRADIERRINQAAIRHLTDYAETVQSKAKIIEIHAVIIALGGTPRTVDSYDPTRMTMGDTP